MSSGRGTFKTVIAGLLALVLLALPGPAMRHAAAAMPVQQTPEHCVSHADAATLMQVTSEHLPSLHALEPGQPCGHSDGGQGLPCGVAAQCIAATGTLPPSRAGPVPSFGAAILYLAPVQARFGIEVPPSLPPPRRLA
ncbi:hypothetical protein [Belnapia sp. F-4-1]|uniref:hypothetical protein n=1 Tax=Belnapia sp. F-4-1 TaxID=1545443 RepID=UPI0005BAB958|nr:hypothetical protein [Belnapia sp. F-4-1]